MINKNKFKIKSTKNILHKIGKRWVVISAVLLGLMTSGIITNQIIKADTTQSTTVKVNHTKVNSLSNATSKFTPTSKNNSSISKSATANLNSSAIANKSSASSQSKNTSSSKSTNNNNDMQTFDFGTKAQQARTWNFVQFGIHHHDFDSYSNYGGYGQPKSASYISNMSSKSSSSSSLSNSFPPIAPAPMPMPEFPTMLPTNTPSTSTFNNDTAISTPVVPSSTNNNYSNDNNQNIVKTSNSSINSHKAKQNSHPIYITIIKSLILHTNKHFTKHNGINVLKPGKSLIILRSIKDHKYNRYEIRLGHKLFYITANPKFTTNTYLQKNDFKHNHKMFVKALASINEYKNYKFNKHNFIRYIHNNTKLHVKRIIKLNKYQKTCLQISKNRFITANKNLIKII